jgi:Rho GDP-dissociation inhibitor
MSDKAEAGGDEGVSDTFEVSEKSSADVGDIMKQDADDEALAKWKASLLGDAAGDNAYSPADDPRRVVIMKLTIMFNGHEDKVYELADQAAVDKMKDDPVVIKEGCEYKVAIQVRVQHQLVTGLKYQNVVSRKGVKVSKSNEMLGSFGPQEKPHEVIIPRREWEEAPSGMMARGSYKATSTFLGMWPHCEISIAQARDFARPIFIGLALTQIVRTFPSPLFSSLFCKR